MVEQSMKRRSPLVVGGGRGRGGLRMVWKTFLTWEGSGRTVMMTPYWIDWVSRLEILVEGERGGRDGWGVGIRGLALM